MNAQHPSHARSAGSPVETPEGTDTPSGPHATKADDGNGATEASVGSRETHDDAGSKEAPPSASPKRKGWPIRAQVLIAVISVLLGVGIVVQVQHTQEDQYSALRQDDLVRLLDEVTQRNEELTDERGQLRRDLSALKSGSGDRRLAEDYATLQEILAGTVPVEGPGVVVTIEDPDAAVDAQRMVHMLEEMRNAGAEAISVSSQRLTTTSAFVDTSSGLTANGQSLSPPYEWRAIGDPQTLSVALDIPGGALASMRNVGAEVTMEERDLVQITAVHDATEPEYAEPTELETHG